MAQAQDRKGTPFEHFQKLLWTNQKPAFRALDQSEATILARFSGSVQSGAIQCSTTQIRLKAGSVNSVPVCHWSATQTTPLPMEPNSWPIMPLVCQFATLLSTEPLLSHLNHWDATQTTPLPMKPYSWPILPMDYQSANAIPLEPLLCHCNHSSVNQG